MSRVLSDWITYYLEFTDETEPPESYHIWTAITLIGGIMGRKVAFPWGHSKIYPNLYVVLVGPSSRTRKGVAMDIGTSIFLAASGILSADAITKEQLIRAIAHAVNYFENPETKTMEIHSSLMTISKELAVFLGQKDIGFIADLTDWYDSHDSWKYETKTSGSDHLRGVCYSLLAGTAPDWFQSMLPLEAVGGGFTARIIFVAEEQKRKIVEEPGLINKQLQKHLISDLEKIGLMTGYFSFSLEAKERYKKWYRTEEEKMKEGIYPIPDPRFHSYCERRATHIKKIGMIIAASHSEEKIVTLEDFNRSLVILEKTESKMYKVFGGLGSAVTGPLIQKVILLLMSQGKVRRSQILETYRFDMTTRDLEEIQNALITMKYIEIAYIDNGSDILYIYKGPNLEEYGKNQGGGKEEGEE